MFIAWIAGSFVAFCTTPPPTGFGWFTLTTVSAVDAFIVAVVVQAVVISCSSRVWLSSLRLLLLAKGFAINYNQIDMRI